MASPDNIRLDPLDPDGILRLEDEDTIWLLGDPFIPPGWEPNPDSTILGGSDVGKGVAGSTDGFGTPVDQGSGNS